MTSQAVKMSLSSKPTLGCRAGLSPLRVQHKTSRRSSCIIRAEEKPQVVQPINGDPFIGMLETPVTSAPIVANFLSNLPAYRTGISPLLRGVEIGLVHGFFLTGELCFAGHTRRCPTPLDRHRRLSRQADMSSCLDTTTAPCHNMKTATLQTPELQLAQHGLH